MWIARDKDGRLTVFIAKPKRYDEYFGARTVWGTWEAGLWIDKESYPEVTWENSPKELVVKEESV